MGNKISKVEHNRELVKQREEMEREYERKIQQLKEQNLREQLNQYKQSLKEAEEQKIASCGEQVRRMEMLRAQQKNTEDALFRRIEEAKTEAERKAAEAEKKKEEEKIQNQKKTLAEYRHKKENIINEESHKIREQFIKDSNTFCLKEIQKYDTSEIQKLVNSFKNSENIINNLEEQIIEKTKEYLEEKGSTVIKHINVLVSGGCGVGKSTLINECLQLDNDHCAKEGNREPCTMGTPQYYDSPKINYLRIADSRGIEKSREYGIDQVVKDIKDFVEGQLLTKDPDKYVHCFWYCITGARLEIIERESIQKIASIYENNKLPIIIVYTKAIVADQYKPIGEMVKELNGNLEFIPVISRDFETIEEVEDEDNEDGDSCKKYEKKIIKKRGIKKLLNTTFEKAKEAVHSSCYTGIKNIIKEEVKQKHMNNNKKMEEFIKNENAQKIAQFKEQMDIREMIYSISDIICNVVKYYLYEGKRPLNNESVEKIQYFLEKFFAFNLKEYKNIFENLVEEKSGKIAHIVYELQKDINIQNKGIMGFIETLDEIKIEIKQKLIEDLKSKAELYCLKNSAIFISEPIRKVFSDLIMNIFENCLGNDRITKLFENSAIEMFNKLQITSKNGGSKSNIKEVIKS